MPPKAPLAGADFATTTGPDGIALFETAADLIRLQPGPFDYATDNYTKDTLIYLEQIAYLAKALPSLAPAPVPLPLAGLWAPPA